jgi:hypothetical protein
VRFEGGSGVTLWETAPYHGRPSRRGDGAITRRGGSAPRCPAAAAPAPPPPPRPPRPLRRTTAAQPSARPGCRVQVPARAPPTRGRRWGRHVSAAGCGVRHEADGGCERRCLECGGGRGRRRAGLQLRAHTARAAAGLRRDGGEASMLREERGSRREREEVAPPRMPRAGGIGCQKGR